MKKYIVNYTYDSKKYQRVISANSPKEARKIAKDKIKINKIEEIV